MWIVELALRRPHTFVVMAIMIVLFGGISIARMPIDIFPSVNVPVVSCVWTYEGMSPYNMENLVTSITERGLISTINGIKRLESMSLNGMSIIKVYLQDGTSVGQSVAMVASVGSAILRQLPRGISAPFVTSSSATDVPVLQLAMLSDTLSEAEIFDIANNLVKGQLATVQGTITPFPYGGKRRQVMIDLDQGALTARQLCANDVVNALKDQNVIAPTGTMKLGALEYIVDLNNIPKTIDELNYIPVKTYKDQVVFLNDVAQVHDGAKPQFNIVNLDGHRAVLFNVLKSGDGSTLSVVDGVKKLLPRIKSLIPPTCEIRILIDQSKFVRECVSEVAREAVIAAGLTALMMLALLGSWRSTLIVAVSIPLAVLSAIIGLNVLGQTINSMTLGGLALSVGMLVDDATVEVENVHRNMAMGKDVTRAILDGAQQVALPALVSTMSICIVFVPVVFLIEPSRSLFMPMGLAVVLAMMASYGLSRTIVPMLSRRLFGAEQHNSGDGEKAKTASRTSVFSLIHAAIETAFEGARTKYKAALHWALSHQRVTLMMFAVLYIISFSLFPFIGQEYFPSIDGGEIRLHVNAPVGTRIEETERIFHQIGKSIRKVIPHGEITSIVDNIGMPVSGINYAYSDSATVGPSDGEILISLSDKRSHSTQYYQKQIRKLMKQSFPNCSTFYQPADIVTQILDAGLPAPLDVKIIGMERQRNFHLAQDIKRLIEDVPGAVDVQIHQANNAPSFAWEVDRSRASQMNLTQNDVSNSFFVTLSSSFQTDPNFWVNPKNGIAYNLAVQTPPYRVSSINDLLTMSVTPETPGLTQLMETKGAPTALELLANVASFKRVPTPMVVNHMQVAPEYDIYADCEGRDLGAVSRDIEKIVERFKGTGMEPLSICALAGQAFVFDNFNGSASNVFSAAAQALIAGDFTTPRIDRGNFLLLAGQALMMKFAYIALIAGLIFALILVYLLLVVNFQSWTDPLIILMAIPGAFSGIMWALFVTQTNFSIPALMGTIMTIGVASANSILMINFAQEQLQEGLTADQAALEAGFQRFRPVIMTATAMIVGMLPMALGLGSGGSQNAPIGRVVIGGLSVATFCTLFFVPMMFANFRRKKVAQSNTGIRHDVDS
jgi:multidrug efflux pump subunit AcrB